jgi:hypothetical protein
MFRKLSGHVPNINFNAYDEENLIDRKSCLGDYEVLNGLPQYPLGRTGIEGRGELLYWGPNHKIELLFTRLIILLIN